MDSPDRPIEQYLDTLSLKLKQILGENLVGVYLMGSGAQKDFRIMKSDLDIMAVVSTSIPDEQKTN